MLKGNYWQVIGTTDIGVEFQTDFLKDPTYGLDGCYKWLLDVIPDEENILDIGCGPGQISEIFRLAGRKNLYHGIDIDPKNIEFAKQLFPDIFIEQYDCHFLPWADNEVDNSLLFDVLDAVPDFRKPLDEAIRVTRKRVIIAIDWNYAMHDEKDMNFIGVKFPPDYIIRINKTKFQEYIKSFGFEVTEGELKTGEILSFNWWIINKQSLRSDDLKEQPIK